jgi:methylphosphonate synthase
MQIRQIDAKELQLLKSGKNFLGILNDIKRRPEDAASELGVSIEQIESIISGTLELTDEIITKATKIWPVNKRDFYVFEDDCPDGVLIMSETDSQKSARIMNRAGKPYYEYRDTAMSKVAPFRPEWILELCLVDDNDPENNSIQWNNGHFLHQFTYFIGNVNFYYKDRDGKKQVAIMNTGDSMYITPFVSHTFATRSDSNSKGLILALTYGGKLTGEPQQELSSMSNLGSEYALDFSSRKSESASLLKFHREISSVTLEELSKRSNISLQTLENFESGINIPEFSELEKIANALTINTRDLLSNNKIENKVIIKNHQESKIWYYPKETKHYRFHELASTSALPFSKSFEVDVLNSDNPEYDLKFGLHQYVYNIGETSVILNWKLDGKKFNKIINPNDSVYIKPFIYHNFRKNGKLLILRIAGKIPGDSQRELSTVGREHTKRAISENTAWFDKEGKN